MINHTNAICRDGMKREEAGERFVMCETHPHKPTRCVCDVFNETSINVSCHRSQVEFLIRFLPS